MRRPAHRRCRPRRCYGVRSRTPHAMHSDEISFRPYSRRIRELLRVRDIDERSRMIDATDSRYSSLSDDLMRHRNISFALFLDTESNDMRVDESRTSDQCPNRRKWYPIVWNTLYIICQQQGALLPG